MSIAGYICDGPTKRTVPMTCKFGDDVRCLPLFSGLSDATFDILMTASYDQVFPARVTLIEEGSSPDFLYVLVEGLVQLHCSSPDRDIPMEFLRPVSAFILAANILQAPYLMSARTLERSRVLLIPSANLQNALASDARFAVNAMQALATSYRSAIRHTKNLKLRDARQKIAAYLLSQSEIEGKKLGFSLPIEKRALAAYLGMTPENLSRSMKSLEKYGCKFDGKLVIITDVDRLERLASYSPIVDGADPSVDGGLA